MKDITTGKFNTKWLIATVLLFYHNCIQTVHGRDYCCEFGGDNICGGSPKAGYYHYSGDMYPNLTGIYGFNVSLAPANFMWIQSPTDVGTFEMLSKLLTIDFEDTFSIEYFILSSDTTFDVTFTPVNPLYTTSVKLFDFIPSGSAWKNIDVVCSNKKSIIDSKPTVECCDRYPCDGIFHFVTNLPASSINDKLLAFSNYILNECPDETLTPANEFCNKFEYEELNWALNGWQYSTRKQPSNYNFNYNFTSGSSYAWSYDFDGAVLASPEIKIDVGEGVTFKYYIDTSIQDVGNSMTVYFNDMDSGKFNPLNVYQSTEGKWLTETFKCTSFTDLTPCCVNYPCVGNVVWEPSWVSGQVFFALDDLVYKDGCENSATCCHFDNENLCNYTAYGSKESPTLGWVWSGTTVPVVSPPIVSTDGDYVYWQTTDPVSSPVYTTLQSQIVTVHPNSSISFSVYASGYSDGSNSKLNVVFHEELLDQINILDNVTDTTFAGTDWMDILYNCTSPHSRCCVDELGCVGWIEFTAYAYENDPPIIFAIDNIQLDSQCIA